MKFKLSLLLTSLFIANIAQSSVILEDELNSYLKIPASKAETEWSNETNIYSGLIYFTEYKDGADNTLAYLTIGANDGSTMEIVADPLAMHRTAYKVVNPSDYTVTPGENVTVTNIDGKVYYNLFHNEEVNFTVTRQITIESEDYYLAKVNSATVIRTWGSDNYTHCSTNNADVKVNGKVMTISYTDGSDIGTPSWFVKDCLLSFDDVYGLASPIKEFSDDLIHNDYLFTDNIGNISLGRLRQWVIDRYDNQVAKLWSLNPAKSDVQLDFKKIVFDNDNKIYFDAIKVNETNKYFQLVANNTQIFKVQMGIFENNNDLKIRKFDYDFPEGKLTFYVDAVVSSPAIEFITNITDSVFIDPVQTTDYPTTYNVDGIDCYKIVVDRDSNLDQGFYRAKGQINGSSKSLVTFNTDVIFKTGTIFEDENGGLWRVNIDTNGVLTTSQINGLNLE